MHCCERRTMPEHDYYKILNVPRNASADDIKKAYKKEVQLLLRLLQMQ